MFLTVHAASGLVIGSYVGPGLWAFLVGFIAHLLLDTIPHDPIEIKRWKLKSTLKFFLVEIFIDIPLTIFVLGYLTLSNNLVWTYSLVWALVGVLILDFLWPAFYLLPKRINLIFWPFYKLNRLAHVAFTKNYHVNYKVWVPLQLITFIIFIVVYLII